MEIFGRKVYFIYDDTTLVYIGLTENLSKRIKQHFTGRTDVGRYLRNMLVCDKFPSVFYYANNENKNASILEMLFINKLKPKLNILYKESIIGFSQKHVDNLIFNKSLLIKHEI